MILATHALNKKSLRRPYRGNHMAMKLYTLSIISFSETIRAKWNSIAIKQNFYESQALRCFARIEFCIVWHLIIKIMCTKKWQQILIFFGRFSSAMGANKVWKIYFSSDVNQFNFTSLKSCSQITSLNCTPSSLNDHQL